MQRLFLMLLVLPTMFFSCNSATTTTEEEQATTTEETTSPEETENSSNEIEENSEGVKGYAIGDIAEDFSLKNVDGKMVSMNNYEEAKGFVVIFTCNHCPYSIAYEDRIIDFDKNYKEKGYPVIAINPNDPEISEHDSPELMIERAKEKGFTFPYLFDEAQTVFPKYGATKTPHCYVLQKTEAGLKVAYIGAFDDNKEADEVQNKHLENAVNALLEGNEPPVTEFAAFGCGIKCKDKSKLAKS